MTYRTGVIRRPMHARALLCGARLVPLAVGAFLVAGCGGGADTRAVSGKITINDKPVTHGIINFQAAGSRPLGGGIQSDGTYTVIMPPGDYQVRIDSPPEVPSGYKEGNPLPKLAPRQVPEKYASFRTSGLTATVISNGTHTIDFNLP